MVLQTQQGAAGELRLECWREGADADPGKPPENPTGPAAAASGPAWTLAAAHAPEHKREPEQGAVPMAQAPDGSVAVLGGDAMGSLAALASPDWKVLLRMPMLLKLVLEGLFFFALWKPSGAALGNQGASCL